MGIQPQQIEAGENNTTCSWRNSNGFSPPNNELCNLLHLPPEKELHMACTVPGGLEKRRAAQPNKGRFSNGCKDTTAGPVSAGLPVTWPQPAFPHQDRDHYAIQAQQFPHPEQQDFPALLRDVAGLRTRSSIYSLGVRVWAWSLTEPPPPPSQSHFLGARLTVPLIKREKGPPGHASKINCSTQLKIPVLKICGGGGAKSKSHFPLKYTLRAASTTAEVMEKFLK